MKSILKYTKKSSINRDIQSKRHENLIKMKIEHLPPEILIKIFSYLPSCQNVALVNRQFYSVVCRIHEPLLCLKLKNSDFDSEHNKKLQSIMNSTRKITKIQYFSGCEIVPFELIDFLEILSLVPNVVHLALFHVKCIEPVKEDDLLATKLNLFHLKTLEVSDCSDDIMLQFNRLPAGVLKTLALDYLNIDELNELFKMQTKMKNLTVEWPRVLPQRWSFNNAHLFDGLQLDSVKWATYKFDSEIFRKMLSKQRKFKSLHVICGTHFVHSEIFAAYENSKATSLDFQYTCRVSNDCIAFVARSATDLKILRWYCDYHIDTIHAVMKNFTFVEVLQMSSFRNDIDEGNAEILSGAYCGNKQLKELRIYYKVPYSTASLEKLIKDYPNLNKLLIKSKTAFSAEQFKMILNGFKKMESLALLGGTYQLKVDDLKMLKEDRNNLKFIALGDLQIELTSETKNNLMETFDVVSFSRDLGLQMAVGRETLANERKIFLNRH